MRQIFKIDTKRETCLWNKSTSSKFEVLSNPDLTIQDAGLYYGQVLSIQELGIQREATISTDKTGTVGISIPSSQITETSD